MSSPPSRSPSGVRLAGDDYQHLVTLREALAAVRRGGVQSLTVEASDAGNVDDVVVRYSNGRVRYIQVKHAVDAQTPVGNDWLTTPSRRGRRSLLQRFFASWTSLRGPGQDIAMALVTDRDVDPSDPVMSQLDRSTHRVLPGARTTGDGREQLVSWSDHVGCTEHAFGEMLQALGFETGLSALHLRQLIEAEFAALGYAADQRCLDSATAIVREWVQARSRTLTPEQIRRVFDERIPHVRPNHALLVVEAIDDHPAADAADAAVRIVELYPELDPFDRRQLTDPDDWQRVVWPKVRSVADACALMVRGTSWWWGR